MKNYIKGFYNYSFLLSELVKKGIRLKYRRSYLGILWSLIEPLLTTCVWVIVFGTLFGNHGRDFPMYLIVGRLTYSFFSGATKAASNSIHANASMIKKIYVPKYLYPLSAILYNFIIYLISMIVLLPVTIYCRVMPTWHIIQVIPALILLLVMSTGFGMILATLNVFFRDVEYLWNVALLLIMYMSAIFYYPEKLLKSGYAWILNYNPLYHVINLCRGAFLGYSIDMQSVLYTAIWAFGSLVIGLIFFKKKQDDFILYM
ncbi:MAG: ABC transporter permease [Eubacteriales bacterium]|nr:ABC transporter permease [Eubacteriales bacterium]